MSARWLEELLDVQPRAQPAERPKPGVRLNLGSGIDTKPGWINVDTDPNLEPDICSDALAHLVERGDNSVDEIYAGHFLEHLEHEVAERFLAECLRVLKQGARIGVVVPDTRAIMQSYLEDDRDLDELCRAFLYSTVQESHHKWSYDLDTLRRILERSGFRVASEIDRFEDPRLHAGAWWQCGLDALKPRRRPFARLLGRIRRADSLQP